MCDRDRGGRIPLHYAALEGNLAALRTELEAGADVNTADLRGYTPPHFAAQEGKTEAARALLDAGAEVDPANTFCKTPLGVAVTSAQGSVEILKLLREWGANPYHRTITAKPPSPQPDSSQTPVSRTFSQTYPRSSRCTYLVLTCTVLVSSASEPLALGVERHGVVSRGPQQPEVRRVRFRCRCRRWPSSRSWARFRGWRHSAGHTPAPPRSPVAGLHRSRSRPPLRRGSTAAPSDVAVGSWGSRRRAPTRGCCYVPGRRSGPPGSVRGRD